MTCAGKPFVTAISVISPRFLPLRRQACSMRPSTSWRRSFNTQHDCNMPADERFAAYEAIHRFLTKAHRPVAVEPGEQPMPLAPGSYELRVDGSRLLLQVWTQDRN